MRVSTASGLHLLSVLFVFTKVFFPPCPCSPFFLVWYMCVCSTTAVFSSVEKKSLTACYSVHRPEEDEKKKSWWLNGVRWSVSFSLDFFSPTVGLWLFHSTRECRLPKCAATFSVILLKTPPRHVSATALGLPEYGLGAPANSAEFGGLPGQGTGRGRWGSNFTAELIRHLLTSGNNAIQLWPWISWRGKSKLPNEHPLEHCVKQ